MLSPSRHVRGHLATAAFAAVMVAGCASQVPPSNFQLARQAVENGDFLEAGLRFSVFANEESARLDAGGDLGRANNTALAYRDAANNFVRAKAVEQALGVLERCVSVLARHGEGELCKTRGLQILEETEASTARIVRFYAATRPFDAVREARRPVVAALLGAQREREEREKREWAAQAPLREWKTERDRVERDLNFARSSETMLLGLGRDASSIRANRRMLEARLADLDARRPNADGSIPARQGSGALAQTITAELANLAGGMQSPRSEALSAHSSAGRPSVSTATPPGVATKAAMSEQNRARTWGMRPDAEATDCLRAIAPKTRLGYMRLENTCGHSVNVGYCVVSAQFANARCRLRDASSRQPGDVSSYEHDSFTLAVGQGRDLPVDNVINTTVYFGACRTSPADQTFVRLTGIAKLTGSTSVRCHGLTGSGEAPGTLRGVR
jgi:hypothetical protein